jgi:hypothetical protein
LAEYALNLLLILSPDGSYHGRIGLDSDGSPLLLDKRIRGVSPTGAAGGFDRLHMAIAARNGAILVADTWNHRIQRLSPNGAYEAELRDDSGWRTDHAASGELGRQPHCIGADGIACPVAIDLDQDNRVLVTAWGDNRLKLYDVQGRSLPLVLPVTLRRPYDARFWSRGMAIADSHNGRVLLVDNLAACIDTKPQHP